MMMKYSTDYLIPYNKKEGAFTQDALFLSWFVDKNPGKTCELGTGTGVISIILARRFLESKITALEIMPDMAVDARKNTVHNRLESQIIVLNQDLKNFSGSGFDTVIMNPPFVKAGHGRECKSPIRDAARNERHCTVDDIFKCAGRILGPEGCLYLIYPLDRFSDVIESCDQHGFFVNRLRFIHTVSKKPAERFMMQAACKYSQLHVMYPLVLYNTDKSFSDEAHKILTGAGL